MTAGHICDIPGGTKTVLPPDGPNDYGPDVCLLAFPEVHEKGLRRSFRRIGEM